MHIFDMDGTLIDSNGIWREVDEAFLAKRGFPYTKEYYQGVAHTIFPLAAEFTKRYCHLEESVEDIMAEWMEMAGDAYATRVQVKPGVREYLDQCRRLLPYFDSETNLSDLTDAAAIFLTPCHLT